MTDKPRTPYVIVTDEKHDLVHRVQRRMYLNEGDVIRPANTEELAEIARLDAAHREFVDRLDNERDATQEAYRAARRSNAAIPAEAVDDTRNAILAYLNDTEYRQQLSMHEVNALLAAWDVWSVKQHRSGRSPRDFFQTLDCHRTDPRDPEVMLAFYAILRQRHYKRCPTDHFTLLGGFDVTSGALRLSDPCYGRDTWCAGTVPDAKNGRWLGFVRYACDWGLRPFYVVAVHGDTNLNHFSIPKTRDEMVKDGWVPLDIHVGVDSGQAGIFDHDNYRNDAVIMDTPDFCRRDKELEPGARWYGACCDKTLGDAAAGVIPGGVVSSSGHGDGGYAAYGLFNGACVGVLIDFMGTYAAPYAEGSAEEDAASKE